ncbi:ABC transporter permease [Streptomyces deccanensis]|uniref:ABC transporter permease n=1 Tax=Streptomyces deccanensis TaxID=424188 RepID=UPI001EFAAAB7|nr:ABC transporter permease [Streptomyces deccanensis]ULR52766.1 ABC transporter permease [Streptomyces deccanensis]
MTLRPVDDLYGQVADIHAGYGLQDPAHRQAVEEAYAAFREHSGPFMVSVAADMLDDLRADVQQNPDRVIAFLGRDGHSLAAAVRGLDPEFFDRHCREVVVSRAVVDAALQDLEKNVGASFPDAEAFRGARKKVDPADVDGSYQNLTDYLRASGVPMGLPNTSVTVVDTSFKGTVQELMTAAYPQTEIQGRYAFLALSPDDPHPEAKQGYVFHQEPDAVWQGLPQSYLPEQRSQTFGNQDALGVIEETLHGPMGSPVNITAQGPHQLPQQFDPQPLVGINPVRVADQYRDPKVREAVKAAAVLAVHDSAVETARSRDAGRDWKGELQQSRERFTDQVRSWVSRDGQTDGRLSTVLDSFVRRGDKNVVKDLDKALKHAGVNQQAAEPLWKRFGELKTLEEKKRFAKDATTPAPGSGKTPQEHLRGVVTAAGSFLSPQAGGGGTSVAKAAGLHLKGRSPGTPGAQNSANQQTGRTTGAGSWRVPRQPGPPPPGSDRGGPKR